MASLILDSLEVQGFRAFQHLRIEHLGRVNLIVGKNNVGKTSLLEAIWIYMQHGTPRRLGELLEARDEGVQLATTSSPNVGDLLSAIRFLFYGREDIKRPMSAIEIGPVDNPERALRIRIGWFSITEEPDGTQQRKLVPPDKFDAVDDLDLTPRLRVHQGQQGRHHPLSALFRNQTIDPGLEPQSVAFIKASGLDANTISSLWDSVALTVQEQYVLEGLQIIAPDVQRLNLVGSERYVGKRKAPSTRIPIVKLRGVDLPVPLRSLGEGMNRLFGIALSLVNARDGVLLIDELESGLHYSVQPDVWRLIFAVARQLNVQVFVTSHSWDCIQAFQQAANEDEQAEGILIRLGHQAGNVVATLYDEEELTIATREQIEVR